MKNLFYISMLVLTAGLTACASDEANDNRNYRYAGRGGCGGAVVAEQPKPAPMPVQQVQYQPAPAPVASSCCPTCSCQAREYTVRTPVKVVYKNTTYRTVYEPRTFETTAYETRPYNRAEVCESGNCGQPTLVSQQPM
ncbi:MAG: hypothetical protein IJ677_06460 [Alphaproteobacteria bacterium]|nr:hypothetical protein [Alphaproteobacteria bacterium]